MYQVFEITGGEHEVADSRKFVGLITGDKPNQFLFVLFQVTFVDNGDQEAYTVGHWCNVTFAGGTTWWFGHGTMNSDPVRIDQENLVRLLFAKRGRDLLAARVQEDFQGRATVAYSTVYGGAFLALPKIQLQGPRSWDDSTAAKIHQKTISGLFINNKKTRKRAAHMHQFVDLVEVDNFDDELGEGRGD